MGHGRGKWERALAGALAVYGWGQVSQRMQREAIPGATPARESHNGRGRGAIVFDIAREDDSTGIRVAKLAGLKVGKARKTTVTVTTGTGNNHIRAFVDAAEQGLDVPIFVVSLSNPILGNDGSLVSADSYQVAVINVGKLIRTHGLPQRTQGQGKGRGNAQPVAWGIKRQTSKAGKTYEYVSIQANLSAAGAKYQTFTNLSDLADFIDTNSEGIFL